MEFDEMDEMAPEVQQHALDLVHQRNLALTGAFSLHAQPLHLYLPLTINNVGCFLLLRSKIRVNFVVDTGAQSTVITNKVAEAASLRRVMNEAIQPTLLGVGTSTTNGALNGFDVCIEGQYFAASAIGRRRREMGSSDAWRD